MIRRVLRDLTQRPSPIRRGVQEGSIEIDRHLDRLTFLLAGALVDYDVADRAGGDREAALRDAGEVYLEVAARVAAEAVSSHDATSPAFRFA